MSATKKDIALTKEKINTIIVEINMELRHSISGFEGWSDKQLALLYVDLNSLHEKKKEFMKKITKLENLSGQELEDFVCKNWLLSLFELL